jgi:hypothetical protein
VRNTPTADEAAALIALINRARALNGWKMQDAQTLEKRMLLWWDVLRQYRIPLENYKELFDMAFDVRQSKMATGEEVQIEAALIVSCWTRPHGLKSIVEQRRIDAGRTLSGNAETQCPRCFGTGQENRFDIDGKIIGVIVGRQCDHRPLEAGEPMFKTTPISPADVFPIDRKKS